MFAIIGIVIVFGGVIGGFVMEKGNLHVLFQPAEFLIIGGAALGSFLVSNPLKMAIGTFKKIPKVFTAKETSPQHNLHLLTLLFEVLSVIRKDGVVALEDHVNRPEKSKIFNRYPMVMKNVALMDFICDNLKVYIAGNVEPYEFEELMDLDIESYHSQAMAAPGAVNKLADALPGLGIVAAVLGVVVTMGKINEPPEVLGHSVGAALVGTFLGILASYGVMGPLASNLEHLAEELKVELMMIKTTLAASVMGKPPLLAVESGRRAIHNDARPTYNQLEEALKLVRKRSDKA